ncbi:unnamed protein product [Lactuca virosa]|uniref:Uncharacterized protein n=1 Tax=Lactuca virosa TaxID=75947 RepID=A0AAU9PDA2_9ASTR|nr:unnamed protein product [Lactuca virosa]
MGHSNPMIDWIHGERKRDKGATQKKNNLPKKKIRLRSTAFINTRPRPSSPGIQALFGMTEENNSEAKWGNSNNCMLLPLSIGSKLDFMQDHHTYNIMLLKLGWTCRRNRVLWPCHGIPCNQFLWPTTYPHNQLDDLQGSLKLIKQAVYANGLVKDVEVEVEGVPQAVFM